MLLEWASARVSQNKRKKRSSGRVWYLMTNLLILSERGTDWYCAGITPVEGKKLSVPALLARRVELFAVMFRISYPIAEIEIYM